jgi:hypothetical protein
MVVVSCRTPAWDAAGMTAGVGAGWGAPSLSSATVTRGGCRKQQAKVPGQVQSTDHLLSLAQPHCYTSPALRFGSDKPKPAAASDFRHSIAAELELLFWSATDPSNLGKSFSSCSCRWGVRVTHQTRPDGAAANHARNFRPFVDVFLFRRSIPSIANPMLLGSLSPSGPLMHHVAG